MQVAFAGVLRHDHQVLGVGVSARVIRALASGRDPAQVVAIGVHHVSLIAAVAFAGEAEPAAGLSPGFCSAGRPPSGAGLPKKSTPCPPAGVILSGCLK